MTTTATFLGINGFEFVHEGKTLLLDPYVSRTSGPEEAVCLPDVVRRHVPRADWIVVSHSHYDHLGDVPEIASYTGAIICGSDTTLNICRHFGVPDHRLVPFEARRPIELGPFTVTPLLSVHKEPMKTHGGYSEVPARVSGRADYPDGGTWALLIQVGDRSFLDLGSADCIEQEIAGVVCDYLLVSIAGRQPDFVPTVLSNVTARCVIPVHWDQFKGCPVEDAGMRYDPDEFAEEVRQFDPNQDVRILQVLEALEL